MVAGFIRQIQLEDIFQKIIMRELLSYEREIFRRLYAQYEPIDVYEFFVTFKLSPGHVAKFIRNSKDKDLVSYEDGKMNLTDIGRKYVVENKHQVYLSHKTPWKKIPEKMINHEDAICIEDILNFSKNDVKSFLNY